MHFSAQVCNTRIFLFPKIPGLRPGPHCGAHHAPPVVGWERELGKALYQTPSALSASHYSAPTSPQIWPPLDPPSEKINRTTTEQIQ